MVSLKRAFLIGAITLMVLTTRAIASDLTVMIIDSKSARPLHHKKVCLLFSEGSQADVRYDETTCGRSNDRGVVIVPAPKFPKTFLHVSVATNDLLPCFAVPDGFPVADVISRGVILANTCGTAKQQPNPMQGQIVIYAHQMTFWEVLKAMGKLE